MVSLLAIAPMIFIVPALIMVAVLLLGFAMLPQNPDLTRKLETFAGNTGPVAKHILIFESLFDENRKSLTTKRLQEAGWYKTTPSMYMAWQFGGAIVAAAVAAVMGLIFKIDGIVELLAILAIPVAYIGPSFLLDSKIKERKLQIGCEVPDFLDAVATAVGAGVALNAALLNAVEVVPGPLGQEFRACLAEIRMGRSRADALNAMAQRANQPDLSQMVTAIVQSERVGGNISQVLEELAAEARNRRFVRAEEIASVLPLKMTFPMALLLLPALFIVIFAPVAAGLATGK